MIIKPSELSENTANILAKLLPQYLDQVRMPWPSSKHLFVVGNAHLTSLPIHVMGGWGSVCSSLKPPTVGLIKEVGSKKKLRTAQLLCLCNTFEPMASWAPLLCIDPLLPFGFVCSSGVLGVFSGELFNEGLARRWVLTIS